MSYSGPFSIVKQNTASDFHAQSVYRSSGNAKRFPLPYSVTDAHCAGGYWYMNILRDQTMSVTMTRWSRDGYAKTYDKFWSKVHTRANLGLTLVESHKSMAMIAQRAKQLTTFTRHLKRGKFVKAAAALGLDSRDPRVKGAVKRSHRAGKDVADQWLEYTFGWLPLINDIADSVNVLQRDFPVERVRVTNRDVAYDTREWDGWPYPGQYGSSRSLVTQCHYEIGAEVKVINPNLLLANELGFTSPMYVAWDAVPFSFVVDWFLPVGKFLKSFSNGEGLELSHQYVSYGIQTRGTVRHGEWSSAQSLPAHGYAFNRSIGSIPRPTMFSRLHLPKVDPWLAGTSVALLLQNLKSIRS